MDTHGLILKRLAIVLAGLCCAILAGSLAAGYAMSFTPPPKVSGAFLVDRASDFAALKPPFQLLMLATLTQVATIFKLMLIGIAAAEWFSIRSWMFQAANGALCGFFTSLFYTHGWVPGLNVVSSDYMLAAGLVGGTVYWLVAGWTAGFRPTLFIPAPIPATTHRSPPMR
ncbi:hypothetical protein GCM10007301_04950 [Azorhizobium oxalatiphilum]|uniref:Uncharacterized protein n=1 Tax=Azorhizobium oxalatiphilum TaxID=980631 RepID=A0A917BK56_9HYPH|nr:hypothetical protein [Azorhizobium oxalatiphilum]GGF48661.1 hypothetical protein GCM10007301_04950 [Azorhizobium oxalatiphilum]